MQSGWTAWLTLATCAIQHGLLISIVYTTASVLLPVLRDELNLSVRQVALPLVAYKATVILLLPLAGWLLDWAGLRVCLLAGTIVTAAVGILFALTVRSLTGFILVQMLASIGYVLGGTAVTVLTANTWWESRLGMSTGIVLGGAAVVSSLTPLLVEIASEKSSWRAAVGIQGCLFAVIVVPLVAAFGAPKTDAPRKTQRSHVLKAKAIRSHEFWLLAGIYFLVYFQIGMIFEHLLLYLQEGTSLSSKTRSGMYAVLNFSVFSGKVVGGLVADMGQTRYPVLLMSSFLMATSSPLLFSVSGGSLHLATKPWQLGAFNVIYGAAFGTMFNSLFALVPSLFLANELGFVQSTLASVYYLSSLTGSFSAALIHDAMGGYRDPFMLLCLSAALNFVLCAHFVGLKTPTDSSQPATSDPARDPAAELLLSQERQ